jgi:sigma-E factor negative regulatory protein RseB
LPEKLSDLTLQYEVKKLEIDRMAGFDCLWVSVLPKDKLRYGRKFCAELGSGLPLRAQVFNENMQVIESFGFSQLSLGGQFSREQVTSRYEGRAKEKKWRVDHSALNVMEQAMDTGWSVTNLPAGFRKSMEVRRTIVGKPVAMPHLVYTDGLAAISVFVEPKVREVSAKPLISQGAVHIYKRALGEFVVTVIGEAPAATVMQIANSMEPRTVTTNAAPRQVQVPKQVQ